ncbi:MAG: phosphonate ABC transporter, permease protein PhnE [Halobacteria archaeon]|nr:phosphonate ABC transporter, permease protein PhnE [Halobacteria archaeon]
MSTETTDGDAVQTKMDDLRSSKKIRRIKMVIAVVLTGVVLYFSYTTVGFSITELVEYWPEFVEALGGYFPITTYFGVIPFLDFGRYWQFIVEASLFQKSVVTVGMAIGGTALGLPGALILGTLGSERVMPFPFNFIFRSTMSVIRSVPALVWALIFIPLGGVSPFTGTLAIGVDTMGYLGRLFTDELEEIESGPIEGIESTGAGKGQTVIFGMLSQVYRQFIAWMLFILELNVRIAITLGLIGAGGLGYELMIQRQTFQYTNMMSAIIVTVLLVLSVETISQRTRAYLRHDEDDESKGLVQRITEFPQRMAETAWK